MTNNYKHSEIIIEETKPWQYGYTLNYLKSLEAEYEPYNKFTYSPFTKYKKNDIAKDLHGGKLIITDHAKWVENTCKVKSPITCYHDVEIAWKQPGDVVISKLCGSSKDIEKRLEALKNASVWVQHFVEDNTYNEILKSQGFRFIGGKVVTSSEIYSIWFRESDNVLAERDFPVLDPVENITLKKLGNVKTKTINDIAFKLQHLNLEFAKSDLTAYVNKDWSALALRGYSDDPRFIADPNEMSKTWNEKHKGEVFTLQNTWLFNHFPEIHDMFDTMFPNTELHRVTFMRMKPNGVLQRHTDQIDWNHGLVIGKLVRFHFPIKTNENVSFFAWETNGNMLECKMKVGEFWLLDTRKPHKVVVNDDQERIHLTVDLRVTPEIRSLMLK